METTQDMVQLVQDQLCSYPTYEEWKLSSWKLQNLLCLVFRSYPTYEEWKQNKKGSI